MNIQRLLIFLLLISTTGIYIDGYPAKEKRSPSPFWAAAIGAGLTAAAAIYGPRLYNSVRGRKRRAVSDNFVEDGISYLDLAMKLDDEECLQKTFCNIMTFSGPLDGPYVLIRKALNRIYSGDISPEALNGHDSAKLLLEAGRIGKAGGSRQVCDVKFPVCTPELEMKSVQELGEIYTRLH